MKSLIARASTLALLPVAANAQADEIYCPAVRGTAHLTSQGELGVSLSVPLDGPPIFEPVSPGDCFYDAAAQDMQSACGAFLEDPGSIGDEPVDGEVAQSKAEMRRAISRLKKKLRSLRRQISRQNAP
jgi:hypothetical protein